MKFPYNTEDFDRISYRELFNSTPHELHLEFLKYVHDIDLKRISTLKKVKIAFQTAALSTWIGDEIVQKFNNNPRYDVTVVLTWQENMSRGYEINELVKHFENTGFNYCIADGTIHPRDFDIIFYTSPYIFALHLFNNNDIMLKNLVCYTPYGFSVCDLGTMVLNSFFYVICWKKFALTRLNIDECIKYCDNKDYGVSFSGYAKMDPMLDNDLGKSAHWKIADGFKENDVKKIIFAPHHSIAAVPFFSTFSKNKDFFLKYAHDHNETSWIIKPHPLLRVSSVKNHLFNSESEYDNYLNKWNELPNARVVPNGNYLPYFASSDAIILDSASFVCEYLYAHKPGLFLTRSGEKFDIVGEKAMECYCTAAGDDYEKIRHFIECDIARDLKKEKREKFFSTYLDYYSINKQNATDYIYNNINNEVG